MRHWISLSVGLVAAGCATIRVALARILVASFATIFVAGCATVLVAGFAPAQAAAWSSEPTSGCAPWPGEPSPLPSTRDRDRFRKEWAAQRARELVRVAELIAEQSRPGAASLWAHAICLDPRHAAYRRGLEQASVVRVFRPPVARTVEPRDVIITENLLEPLRVWIPPEAEAKAEAPRGEPEFLALDAAIRAARFEEALELADAARAAVGGSNSELASRRARIEILAAIADIGMGQEGQARASLERAAAADPSLQLDPREYSPKLLSLWDSVVTARRAAP